MGITTRKGDKGQTDLYSGERVDKNCVEIECVGEIDELNSYLGIAKINMMPDLRVEVEYVQKMLFKASSDIATLTSKEFKNRVDQKDLDELDMRRDNLEDQVGKIKTFVYPGATLLSAHLDYARALSRRVERRLVSSTVTNKKMLKKYFNRLSDYLYLMARLYDAKYRKYLEKN
jgi:cob(I)alamin adenosyltransferase